MRQRNPEFSDKELNQIARLYVRAIEIGIPLRQRNPGFSEEELYQTARLIVAALNARIHTVEWTPALFGNELMNVTMHNNWRAPRSAPARLAGYLHVP